jgi:transposase
MERTFNDTEVKKLIAEAIAPLVARIAKLETENTALKAEVARLKKNSSNSSKPPSSDIVKPPPPPAAGGDAKRKIGGQPGHVKHERASFTPDQIDRIVRHDRPPYAGLVPLNQWAVLQQIDLAENPCVITEHRAQRFRDPATGRIVPAAWPREVEAAGLVGPRLTALIAYLKSVCHTSFSTIRKFCREVLGATISRGQLAKVLDKVSQALQGPHEELQALLPRQARLNVDETGHKNNGQPWWTWCLRAPLFTYFKIDESRGSQVLLELLGAEFNGLLGCDYFSAYRKYLDLSDVRIQFCLAHLIRDVKFLITLPDQVTAAYGQRVLSGLRRLFHVIHRRDQMAPARFQRALEQARDEILAVGKHAPKRNEAQNLADRFRRHGEAYFRFITTPGAVGEGVGGTTGAAEWGIDPTNNLAEQAIRFVVIDRYVTQGTRSQKGRNYCQRAWTAVATCAQQARSVYHFFGAALAAAFNGTPIPSLLPAAP